MLYKWKVKLLKNPKIAQLWRNWHARRGHNIGAYDHLPMHIRHHVPGRSFVDVGCMWGANGEHAFIAEEAGATEVKGVDIFGPTPEFLQKKGDRRSSVEFILGDICKPQVFDQVGVMDVILCAGVLYHHPSPFDLLVALRRICGQMLILRMSTIPENPWMANSAVYYPMLNAEERKLWDLTSVGLLRQVGINNAFEPAEGYGNWFWGLTPSCLISLLETAGFKVDFQATEPFAQTMICTPSEIPFEHRLPGEYESRELGKMISEAGLARPA